MNLNHTIALAVNWSLFSKKALISSLLLTLGSLGSFVNMWTQIGGREGYAIIANAIAKGEGWKNIIEKHLSSELFPFASFVFSLLFNAACLALCFFVVEAFLQGLQRQTSEEDVEKVQATWHSDSKENKKQIGFYAIILTLISPIILPWLLTSLLRKWLYDFHINNERILFKASGLSLFLIFFLSMLGALFVFADPRINIFVLVASVVMNVSLFFTFICHWFFNGLSTDKFSIKLFAPFFPMWGWVALELTLSVLTLGFYLPVALNKYWKYISANIEIAEKNKEKGLAIGFETKIENTFNYASFLFPAMLSVLTLGLALPWLILYSHQKWFAETSWVELG